MKRIVKNSKDIESAKISIIPSGYKFPSNNLEKYVVQLAMLNHLHSEGLITDREFISIKRFMKSRYKIE